jgi:hypothetical protein
MLFYMIYTPSKYPRQAFILITLISATGMVAGVFVHSFFMICALIFWMQYTAILSYLQFRKKKKFNPVTFTELLLNPQIRFFAFEFLGAVGLFGLLKYNWKYLGALVLFVWWLFSLNFYRYYSQFRKYE